MRADPIFLRATAVSGAGAAALAFGVVYVQRWIMLFESPPPALVPCTCVQQTQTTILNPFLGLRLAFLIYFVTMLALAGLGAELLLRVRRRERSLLALACGILAAAAVTLLVLTFGPLVYSSPLSFAQPAPPAIVTSLALVVAAPIFIVASVALLSWIGCEPRPTKRAPGAPG